MDVLAGKILKSVNHLDPEVFTERDQLLESTYKGMTGAYEGRRGADSVPSPGLAEVLLLQLNPE